MKPEKWAHVTALKDLGKSGRRLDPSSVGTAIVAVRRMLQQILIALDEG